MRSYSIFNTLLLAATVGGQAVSSVSAATIAGQTIVTRNVPPTAVSRVVEARVGKSLRAKLSGSDADSDRITFKLESPLPAGLSYDYVSTSIFGTPTQAGDYTVVFRASDGELESEPATIVLHIAEFGGSVVNISGPDNPYDNETTLGEAVEFAARANVFTPITFELADDDRTITLSKTLTLYGELTIIGPTQGKGIVVQRSSDSPGFPIVRNESRVARLANLTLLNGVGSYGGGIFNHGADLTLENCTIANNRAVTGAGIWNHVPFAPATLKLITCTLTGNVATGYTGDNGTAGAGAIEVSVGNISLESCTVVGNQGTTSGGIDIVRGGQVTLHNSIVAGNNEGASAPVPDVRSTLPTEAFISQGHNLIGRVGTGATFEATGDQTGVTASALKINPLANNGGSTLTMALRPGSPAINAGDTALTADQRGLARPAGTGDDIGAFEAQEGVKVSIQKVVLTPEAPLAGQEIKAQVTATASNGREPFLSYTWTRKRGDVVTRLPATDNILATTGVDVRQGDIITVSVVATLEASQSAPVTASVTVGNTPLVITGFDLRPRNPYTFEKMAATVRYTDPDKTKPTFTWVWKKNGVVTRSAQTKSSQDFYNLRTEGFGDKGDKIEVSVVVSDGASSQSASGSATIRNSAPVVSLLTLNPQSPAPTGTVISTYGARDADGDPLARTYKWRVGTRILKEEKGARVDLSKYPFVKAGDVVSVDLQVSDGQSFSKTLTAKVTVAATLSPSAALAPLSPSAVSS